MQILINNIWTEFDIQEIKGRRKQFFNNIRISNTTLIKIICKKCGKQQIISLKKLKIRKTTDELCNRCLTKQTFMLLYGVECNLQNTETKETIKTTNIKKYGVDNPAKSKQVQEKTRQTNIKKYGKPYIMQIDKFKIKFEKNMMEKYGIKYSFQNGILRDKSYITMINKYGYKSVMQNASLRNKICSFAHSNFITSFGHKILYQSTYELEFIQCCEKLNIEVKNGPQLEYIYNGKKHFYYVDFEIDGNLIEIKASHHWYYQDLKDGILDAKNKAAETFCKNINKKFLFILDDRNLYEEKILSI